MRAPFTTGWVLEWHDAGGGKTRSVGLPRRRFFGLIAVFAFSASALLAGGLVAVAERSVTRAGIASARSLNESLRARRNAFERRALELRGRSGSPESVPSGDRAPRTPRVR